MVAARFNPLPAFKQQGACCMSHAFDFLVCIGRFQPFHNGHLAVVEAGLRQARQLILLCGSAEQPRSIRNPFTWQEREAMMRSAVAPADQARLLIVPLADSPYNEDRWVRDVQCVVQGVIAAHHQDLQRAPRIGLIGRCRAQSAYYPNRFPQWEAVAVDDVAGVNATAIRHSLLGPDFTPGTVNAWLPPGVQQWLTTFAASDICRDLRAEQAFITAYKQGWSSAPYEPNFVTVDAAVVQSGHILLIERDRRPGRGLLALPGGFVDPGERIQDACLRELVEETCIGVPLPVLRGCIKQSAVFDAPHRSARCRTITHAFHLELEPGRNFPSVAGSDDARTAQWVPLGELDPQRMFEDHYFIIQSLVGL